MSAKTLKRTRTEREVTAEVIDALRHHGLEPKRQNVGGLRNASGSYVAFGEPGDSDWRAELPDGRTLYVEVKREGFDPAKCRGKDRERFDRQLAKLRLARMVTTRQDGTRVHYRLVDEHASDLVADAIKQAEHAASNDAPPRHHRASARGLE